MFLRNILNIDLFVNFQEGKTYKHCDDWEKCVKPSWFLCSQCQKCRPQDHKCDDGDGAQAKRFVCHSYGKEGHKRVVYPKRKVRFMRQVLFLALSKSYRKGLILGEH